MRSGALTAVCAVIGDPISHSMSPVLHNAALAHDGIDAVYLSFQIGSPELDAALGAFCLLGFRGLNVTLPHKTGAANFASTRTKEVDGTGAANTLIFDSGTIHAHNTDVLGFRRAVELLGIDIAEAKVLVLGAGGAARAVVWALTADGAQIVIHNRTHQSAKFLADSAQSAARIIDRAEIIAIIGQFDLVVNTTSVGLDMKSTPLSFQELEAARSGASPVILDLVYGPSETPLVRASRELGLRAADGRQMLVAQAAEAYRLFWNREAPTEIMQQACDQFLGFGPPPEPTAIS